MNMSEWAKREVEIACEKRRRDKPPLYYPDYSCSCYESALKAFNSLCEDGHSGHSIKITKTILNNLIDGKPLTPIEDTEDVWNRVSFVTDSNGIKTENYQCKRMSSLFKDVDADGTVKYSDTQRVICYDIHHINNRWFSGFVLKLIDELCPIEMPYIPNNKPILVACENLLTDPKNGDFDTLAVMYAKIPDDDDCKIMVIRRYFKDDEDGPSFVEITEEEFLQREEMDQKRREDFKKLLLDDGRWKKED